MGKHWYLKADDGIENPVIGGHACIGCHKPSRNAQQDREMRKRGEGLDEIMGRRVRLCGSCSGVAREVLKALFEGLPRYREGA